METTNLLGELQAKLAMTKEFLKKAYAEDIAATTSFDTARQRWRAMATESINEMGQLQAEPEMAKAELTKANIEEKAVMAARQTATQRWRDAWDALSKASLANVIAE